MTNPNLKSETVKIKQLVDEYRSGRLVIPEFQREYVWKRNKAPLLLDSLYRQFPIASLLVWQSAEDIRARRKDPRPARGAATSWLIDGQQRVITLSKALYGDEGIDIVYHPENDEFQLANAANQRDRNWFKISELLDDDLYRRLRRNLDGGSQADRREERFERVRAILEYEVPLVRMKNHKFNDAVLAFKRINTLGVKLRKHDIESAQIAAQHSGFIADEVAPFLESLKQKGFSRLNVMHLFRACAFVAKPDGRNRTPLHELDKREVLDAWKDTKRAAEQAITLVRSELGLVNMDILWSGSLLVPIIALCATTKPKDKNAKSLMGWLALAALLHRYSGSAETALEQDLRACRADDPIGALLGYLRQSRPSLAAHANDFTGALNDRSGLLAAYVACMHKGVLDFYTGQKILLDGHIDRHHILPRGQFSDKHRSSADTIANIAFISGEVNRAISHSGPEVYLKQLSKKVLQSQCIPNEPGLWSIEHAGLFWDERRKLLAESFNDFLKEALPQRRGVGKKK